MSDNGATAPISALTNAFSLGSNRGHRTDDFGLRIIAPPADIEQKSAHLRRVVKRIRHAIGQMRTGIATLSNRIRTFLDQVSATPNRIRYALTQESNRLRASIDDLSVEVIARNSHRGRYAELDSCNEPP